MIRHGYAENCSRFRVCDGDEESIKKNWAKYYIAPAFKAACIDGCHMMSHRLSDTFAVDLLEKGLPLEEVSKLLGSESIKATERHHAKWVKGRQTAWTSWS